MTDAERIDFERTIEELRADRDQWRNLAMKEHISLCKLEDHNLCVDYLTWRHGQEMREAGWPGR